MSEAIFMTSIRRLAIRAWRRLTWEAKCLISPDRIVTFCLVDGSRLDYPIKSALGYGLSMTGFETSEIAYMRRSLKTGDIVFDVGANAGIYTVIAAKQVGSNGHIYAFEPGKRELDLLRHNISINNLSNVSIVPLAVSNKNGTAQFAIASDGALNSLRQTQHPDQKIQRWETVETITLDSFVKEQNISKVAFIKIDVEGAEKLVIEGATELLSANPQVKVLFESYTANTTSFDYTPQAFLSEMVKLGLSIHYLAGEGSHFAISGNIPGLGTQIYSFLILPKD